MKKENEVEVKLFIENLKNVTIIFPGTVIGPKKSSSVFFTEFKKINVAMNQEKDGRIKIHTDIPQWVKDAVAGKEVKQQNTPEKEETPKEEEPKEKTTKEVKEDETTNENTDDEEVVDNVPDYEEVAEEPTKEDETTENYVTDEKPDWYLSYDAVEAMPKKEIYEHFKDVEEIVISSNKNAAETKETAHEQLQTMFPDHTPA